MGSYSYQFVHFSHFHHLLQIYHVWAIESRYDSVNYTYNFLKGSVKYSVIYFMTQCWKLFNSNLPLTLGRKKDTVVTPTIVTTV